MRTKSYELVWALLAMIVLGAGYVLLVDVLGGIPAAQSLAGHSIGLLGALLVLMTETLYTLRKRSHLAHWGSMAGWLQFHIFTGLVGPFLILLHTSWMFNGLAGVVTLMMVIVVISGFFGRYVYTAIPRTADGTEQTEAQLDQHIRQVEKQLQNWLAAHPDIAARLDPQLKGLAAAGSGPGSPQVTTHTLVNWSRSIQWDRLQKQLTPGMAGQVSQIREFLHTRTVLQRQKNSLALSRRALSVWHSLHVPLGLALFTAALIHMLGALYYATFIK